MLISALLCDRCSPSAPNVQHLSLADDMYVNRVFCVWQDTSSDLQLFAILSVTLVVTGGLLKGSVIKFFDALLPLNDVSNEGAWWRNFYQVSSPALLHVQRRARLRSSLGQLTHTAHLSCSVQMPCDTIHDSMSHILDYGDAGRAAAVWGELPAGNGPTGGAGLQPRHCVHWAGVLRPHPGTRRAGARVELSMCQLCSSGCDGGNFHCTCILALIEQVPALLLRI